MSVELPPVYETVEVGDIKPQKDMERLVGIGEVTLETGKVYTVYVFQGDGGKQAAKLDNKFDLDYLDKVKEARGKEVHEDAEALAAAMTKLHEAKPKIDEKVLEKWKEIAVNLDFEVGKPPKLEGEMAEVWAKKDKAESDMKDEMAKQQEISKNA